LFKGAIGLKAIKNDKIFSEVYIKRPQQDTGTHRPTGIVHISDMKRQCHNGVPLML
jgi:hypothetical protein